MISNTRNRLAIALAALVGLAQPALAQDRFYEGKRIEIIVPAASGSYNNYAQLIADHLPRFLAGTPTVTPTAMAGAGGIKASNHVANVGARDGTTLYMMHQNAPVSQVLTPDKVQYDVAAMQPIGIVSDANSILAIRVDSGVASVADAATREVTLGSTGVGSYTYIIPTVLNSMAGTRFKVVSTYPGSSEILLAVERGEIAGLMTSLTSLLESHPEWVDGKDLARVILQVGARRDPAIPAIPLLTELATTDEQKAMYEFMSISNAFARSLVAPQGVPAEQVETLRKAFAEMVVDPQYIADAAKRRLPLAPADAETLSASIRRVLDTSAATIEAARAFVKE